MGIGITKSMDFEENDILNGWWRGGSGLLDGVKVCDVLAYDAGVCDRDGMVLGVVNRVRAAFEDGDCSDWPALLARAAGD